MYQLLDISPLAACVENMRHLCPALFEMCPEIEPWMVEYVLDAMRTDADQSVDDVTNYIIQQIEDSLYGDIQWPEDQGRMTILMRIYDAMFFHELCSLVTYAKGYCTAPHNTDKTMFKMVHPRYVLQA